MNTSLNVLLEAINKMFESEFNGILINRYNSGDEYIGPLIKFLWGSGRPHSDDEKYLDKSGVVAISCGGERIFRIRNKYTKKLFQDIPIKNMDVIHMGGNFQKEFTHEIPQTKKPVGLRYSFTFRHHTM